jgi:hypothetical protein
MNGSEIMQGLIGRGYTPYHAAAIAGHILQESGGNPSALNKGEGANGLVQWRLDRWDNLQNFAKSQGKSPNDANVQLDFIGKEMDGPEKKSSEAFRNATDVSSASDALRKYIRFGDDSAGTRLNNSVGLLKSYDPSAVIPSPSLAPTGASAPPGITDPAAVGALAQGAPQTAGDLLKQMGGELAPQQPAQPQQAQAPQQPEFLPEQQLQPMQRPNGNSLAIAQALAKAYGIG